MSFDLEGQSILITGAAGKIGSSIALQALKAKAKVVISDVSKDRLLILYENLSNNYENKVHAVHADASTVDGINYLIQESLNKAEKLTGAVHSAYPTSKGWGDRFENLKAENLYQDLSLQLGGAILFSQTILRLFEKQKQGNLIHISSIQGVQAPKFEHYEGTEMTSPIEYCAIKSGLIGITKWLAKYYHSKNIRINCVSPGGILDCQPESFLEKYRKSCTNIGMLSPEHVSNGVVFLLSPAANAINGQNLVIDDGWSL